MKKIESIDDIVSSRLCIGCGACVYASRGKYRMVDFHSEGLRPKLVSEIPSVSEQQRWLSICPSYEVDFGMLSRETSHPDSTSQVEERWGKISQAWEGYASDPDIRYKGSSGGALTAIAAFCIEKLGMSGTLHIGQDSKNPARNKTIFSNTRDELIGATGSRYSPASVCERLDLVENAKSPCVVIGKPAEIAATRNAARESPKLKENLGATLSFFCAETPPSLATDHLLKDMGVELEKLSNLRYRGLGWPGHFAPIEVGHNEPIDKMTYQKSWAFLQKFRPWSTQIWPDGSGELADISCGDPWYEKPDGENPGFSLIVARTETGKRIVEQAIEAEYLTVAPAEIWKIEASQRGLLAKKGSVWGRRIAMKALGMPTTHFINANLFRCWKLLPLSEKMKSVLGTMKRIIQRKLRKPLVLE